MPHDAPAARRASRGNHRASRGDDRADTGAGHWRERLTALARGRACAEAAELAAALGHLDAEVARIEADQSGDWTVVNGERVFLPAEVTEAQRGAVIYEIGRALGWSPAQASLRLARAARVREELPIVWNGFLAGRLDASRVYVLADAAARLERLESLRILDARAAEYACSHTLGELRRWLRRLIAQLEPDIQSERAHRALAERCVSVEHREEGMSELWALLPTMHAVVIDQALTKAAKRVVGSGRTLSQARADVLADVLTGGKLPHPAEQHPTGQHLSPEAGQCASPGTRRAEAGTEEPAHPRESTPDTPDGHMDAPAMFPEPGAGLRALSEVRVHIGVTVPAEALAGVRQAPAVGDDGSWTIPVPSLLHLLTGDGPPRSPADHTPPPARGDKRPSAANLREGQPRLGTSHGPSAAGKGGSPPSIRAEDSPPSIDADGAAPRASARDEPPARVDDGPPSAGPGTAAPADSSAHVQTPPAADAPGPASREKPEHPDHRVSVFWHRLLLGGRGDGGEQRDGGEMLHADYVGRFPPETLRAALGFRDGSCSVPGCMTAPARCDVDHRVPWPAGPTAAANLDTLCRRHHRWKTMGVITPVEVGIAGNGEPRWGWQLPSGEVAPVERANHAPLAPTSPQRPTRRDQALLSRTATHAESPAERGLAARVLEVVF
ncbi:HNH endonuclease [Sediminivirga luteola]|uniref:HNH endonuclease signature motif containing protein n=1 Tax=Sediminivirga luteola TaxID=1774748 RepID=UPI001F578EA8|nr:HNH endonuclease signature motif containing protein [Sediminivirga luteola]MCI2263944.1 DUF222 domain-containing protein [Sediminivirga luteola]